MLELLNGGGIWLKDHHSITTDFLIEDICKPLSKMSDILSRGFRAQLTTTMDSILRRAVFEIMKIFENTLYDNQMELAQKGEEVAQLKIKLQTAELKLKDLEDERGKQVETNKTQTNSVQTESEVVVETAGHSSEVPEIDFEVPDDWCAPLGCEMMTRPDEGMCPSVRLRPLSIPLWHIPVRKNEVVSSDIDLNQKTEVNRRSQRISDLNESNRTTKDKKLPAHDQEVKHQPLLSDTEQENLQVVASEGLRPRRMKLSGKEQEHTAKSKKEQRKSAAFKSESKQQEAVRDDSKNPYTCKLCKKVYDTKFGLSVHIRSHKRCQGCKKHFPIPSVLRSHKSSCRKFQKLLARKKAKAPKTSCGKEEMCAPRKKQVLSKKSKPSSKKHNQNGNENAGRYSCSHCSKKFKFHFKLVEHMRCHTGEKPYSCSICHKKFRIAQSLKVHMMRRHKDQKNATDVNGDLAWTKPLEEIEENRENPVSPSKHTGQEIEQNKGKRSERSSRWQTMGVQHNDGFMCSLCHKVLKTKVCLIEHYRIHTGERPLVCDKCPANFRTSSQLYMHKKKCHFPAITIQCDK